jgi:hypothetical protein
MESDLTEFRELLDQFVDNSQRNIGDYNSEKQEEILIQMLNLVKGNSGARQDFAQCFIDIVNDPNCGMTWAVVLFCMRELQWPEVKEAIERFIASQKGVSDSSWRTMLEAYKKEWSFHGHFRYYDKREPIVRSKDGLFARIFGSKKTDRNRA